MPNAATWPELVFQMDTGTLHIGDQVIATQDMLEATTMNVSAGIMNRISALEDKLCRFQQKFTAELASEIVRRSERFVSERELTGMTDEEFAAELGALLFGEEG